MALGPRPCVTSRVGGNRTKGFGANPSLSQLQPHCSRDQKLQSCDPPPPPAPNQIPSRLSDRNLPSMIVKQKLNLTAYGLQQLIQDT